MKLNYRGDLNSGQHTSIKKTKIRKYWMKYMVEKRFFEKKLIETTTIKEMKKNMNRYSTARKIYGFARALPGIIIIFTVFFAIISPWFFQILTNNIASYLFIVIICWLILSRIMVHVKKDSAMLLFAQVFENYDNDAPIDIYFCGATEMYYADAKLKKGNVESISVIYGKEFHPDLNKPSFSFVVRTIKPTTDNILRVYNMTTKLWAYSLVRENELDWARNIKNIEDKDLEMKKQAMAKSSFLRSCKSAAIFQQMKKNAKKPPQFIYDLRKNSIQINQQNIDQHNSQYYSVSGYNKPILTSEQKVAHGVIELWDAVCREKFYDKIASKAGLLFVGCSTKEMLQWFKDNPEKIPLGLYNIHSENAYTKRPGENQCFNITLFYEKKFGAPSEQVDLSIHMVDALVKTL